jgi:tetratricopeptide (TPR) repeat protein
VFLPARKIISDAQHDGDLGEAVARVLIKKMGHEFHPTGRNEAGIDGFIELRDGTSGEVNAQIISCQVKSGKSILFDQTESEFAWRAAPGDLTYWENSNAPVIVVIIDEAAEEGWWRAVDEAFPDEDARASRVIRFNKTRDQLRGAPGTLLHDVVLRDRRRRRAGVQMILAGPYATVGLTDELARALKHEEAGRWREAAACWSEVAAAATEKRIDRRLVWPAMDSAARALEMANARDEAGPLWIELVAAQVDDDYPEARWTVGRAMWTSAWTDSPAHRLLSVRATMHEQGVDALDDLRGVLGASKSAGDRQAAAAALVDALVFYGEYDEAFGVAEKVLGKRHDTPQKRQLALDRLDCAGELGEVVADTWDELIEDWRDRGPTLHGQVLQRRAVYELRLGNADAARDFFGRAAEVWAATDGAEEQVAEVALSAAMVDELVGHSPGGAMPPGARAAAAIARGSIRTPAVRSDRLINAGPAYFVDRNVPDAIARLTMAAMLDRRAGNFLSWRNACYLLARTYDEADEPAEALRLWLLIGATTQASETAKRLKADVVLEMIRLSGGPGWQRSASLAALDPHGATLSRKQVGSIARAVVAAAQQPANLMASNPSLNARRVLAKVCDRLPTRYGERAGEVLSAEVVTNSPNGPEASAGLLALTKRELYDGVPVILDALLAGRNLPVTIAGWIREAPDAVVEPLIKKALGGNLIALAELAAAEYPLRDEQLRRRCDTVTKKMVKSGIEEDAEIIGASFTDQPNIVRFARPGNQKRWVEMICGVVGSARYDEVSKTSALIAMAVAAPGLRGEAAELGLERLLPVARGVPVKSAPGVLTDHRNPKRARSKMTRAVPAAGIQAAAIQACGRLARVARSGADDAEHMLRLSLGSQHPQVIRMALRELSGLPALAADVDPGEWLGHEDGDVRAAAEQLARARRGEPTTD